MTLEFMTAELAVPVYQIGILLLASTLALLFGRLKLSLLINYLFTMYWGYILNRDAIFGNNIGGLEGFTAFYFGFGIVIALLASLGFLLSGSHN